MVNVTKKFGAAAIALAAVSAGLPAQQVMQVNVDALGPQVGQKALALRLPDQNGRQRDLTSLRRQGLLSPRNDSGGVEGHAQPDRALTIRVIPGSTYRITSNR